MKLAVTPGCEEFVLLLVDTDTGAVEKIASDPDQWENQKESQRVPAWRRFGITWSEDTLFVAARHNVLCFDQNLQYLYKIPNILGGNPHQIVHYEDELYVVNTSENNVIALNSAWESRIVYDTDRVDAHLNSLLIGEDFFWINASNRGESQAEELYTNEKKLTGQHSHNLGLWDGDLCSIDTNGTGWLTTGFRSCRLTYGNHFCRGLAISDDQIVVGVSAKATGYHNYNMPCHIQILDHQGRMQNRIDLPGLGPIHDIRLLDTFDHAHLRNPFL